MTVQPTTVQPTAIVPRPISASALSALLVSAAQRKGTLKGFGAWLSYPRPKLVAALRSIGIEPIPFGDGDDKTGVPGTYRPVGAACPSTCRYLSAGCYALGGRVAMAQRRSWTDVQSAVATAAAAIVWALATGRPAARLHVSGDFGSTPTEVRAYLNGLAVVLPALRSAMADAGLVVGPIVAWTYTHWDAAVVTEEDIAQLRDAGLSIRRSDSAGRGGVVVVPFTGPELAAVRAATSLPVAKCPAQLRNVNCSDCRLCWERPDVVIAFDPHGQGAAAARAAAAA